MELGIRGKGRECKNREAEKPEKKQEIKRIMKVKMKTREVQKWGLT